MSIFIVHYQLLIKFAANFRLTSGEIRECWFESTILKY